jgi:hypothetical protein
MARQCKKVLRVTAINSIQAIAKEVGLFIKLRGQHFSVTTEIAL